ncbi:MAG: IS1634 family transposase [Rudaea sp.]
MFVKRNHTTLAGKNYQSVLLVQGKRVPAKRSPGRPALGAPAPKSVVVHQTLANLSKLPPDLIAIIERHCKGPPPPPDLPSGLPGGSAAGTAIHLGPCYGVLAALDGLAREMGLVQVLGEQTRSQRLGLFLIYARLAHRGSRLSAARWSEDHAVKEILRVGAFDEDDLYRALEVLAGRQGEIEAALAPKAPADQARAIYLYDVTSVYFEGRHNELADFGYNRDGKTGKKQLVAGLLTDANGEPISIQLYRGNTADPPTFLDAVQKLKARFGAEEVALVGDRGMIKRLGKVALGEARFRYVTALTDPQIRALLAKKRLQLELFEDKPAEVELEGKRYVLRCNPQTQARERARRADQWARVQAKIGARNQLVEQKPRSDPASSLRQAQALVRRYRLGGWVKVELAGRKVVWTEDGEARQQEGQLDGCYVIESDLPKEAAGTQQVHDRYLDLTRVERDFRTLKTGLLELRPVFLRKEGRTRGHALVCLLALKLARELDRRLAPLGLTVEDGLERLKAVRLVRLGNEQVELWRLPDGYPPAQTEVLEALPRLKAPMLSLGKPNTRRLTNPRKGRA